MELTKKRLLYAALIGGGIVVSIGLLVMDKNRMLSYSLMILGGISILWGNHIATSRDKTIDVKIQELKRLIR